MEISKYNRSKITILNSILIMMVLYVHGYYLEAEQHDGALTLQRFIGTATLCSPAVRLFFFISGLLFFNGISCAGDCFGKIKKRVRSILIPYLIWNVIFVLWFVIMKFTPGVSSFVNSDIFCNFSSLWDGIRYLWITPAAFQLWFLRDLIILIALTPIIWLYIRHTKMLGVAAYLLVSVFIPNSGTFFVIGGAIALLSNLEELEKYLPAPVVIVAAFIFILGCVYYAVQPIGYYMTKTYDSVIAYTGVITIWRLYDFIAKGRCIDKTSIWSGLIGYSFFIYLFHEPVFNIIKKVPIRVFGDSELIVMFFFLINPIIMSFVAIGVAKSLQKIMPKVYSVLVGGR